MVPSFSDSGSSGAASAAAAPGNTSSANSSQSSGSSQASSSSQTSDPSPAAKRHARTSRVAGSAAAASGADGSGRDGTGGSGGRDKSARVPVAKGDAKAGAGRVAPAQPAPRFEIDQFAVEGADALRQFDVETAVYPFLGPSRTAQDVEKARAALEKSYHDRGYQTVSVSIPPQNPQGGIIVLKVAELKVGRLRVKNAHYYDIDKIKQRAASLKEGTLPNFNAVTSDIVALNQWPDRRITPALRAGVTPGTVDVDLNVDDKPPIHGSLEINDQQSPAPRCSV